LTFCLFFFFWVAPFHLACVIQHLTSSSLDPQAMGERRQGDPVTSLPPSLPPSLPSLLLQAPQALQQHLAKMFLSLSFLLPTACGISAGMAPPFVPVARAEEVNLLEQLEVLNKQVRRPARG
jgi:hypothetical protein